MKMLLERKQIVSGLQVITENKLSKVITRAYLEIGSPPREILIGLPISNTSNRIC